MYDPVYYASVAEVLECKIELHGNSPDYLNGVHAVYVILSAFEFFY